MKDTDSEGGKKKLWREVKRGECACTWKFNGMVFGDDGTLPEKESLIMADYQTLPQW